MPHRLKRSWYTGRWWVGCYIWYSEEGPGRAAAPLYCYMMVHCAAVLMWLIDELSGCVGWSTQQFSSLCVVWTSSDKSSANDWTCNSAVPASCSCCWCRCRQASSEWPVTCSWWPWNIRWTNGKLTIVYIGWAVINTNALQVFLEMNYPGISRDTPVRALTVFVDCLGE